MIVLTAKVYMTKPEQGWPELTEPIALKYTYYFSLILSINKIQKVIIFG